MSLMFRFKSGGYNDDSKKLIAKVRRGGLNALKILGFNVRKTAQTSIKSVPGHREWRVRKNGTPYKIWVFPASKPGSPPFTHPRSKKKRSTSGQLPQSILYDIENDPDAVVIGPSAELFHKTGRPHERGGSFRGRNYPDRPFMGPALANELGSLPGLIADQIQKQTA
jgi:hypothetical protein